MKPREFKRILKYPDGSEMAMIRGDISLSQMELEKPSGRWSPDYWHPDFEKMLEAMQSKYKLEAFGNFIDYITYGQVGSRVYSPKGTVRYIQTINLVDTGVDFDLKAAWIEPGSHNDLDRSRLQVEDILLGNAGMGGLGKCVLFTNIDLKANISQDIDLIRVKGLNPYFGVVFLKSEYGLRQIWRRARGVGAPKLPFDEIREIRLPLIPAKAQESIKAAYLKMSAHHDKAMEGRAKGNAKEYSANIKLAEHLLKDLVSKTEAFIRGEREDID